MHNHRDNLLSIFGAALEAVSGEKVVKTEIESGNYPQAFHVVAIGKAADAMLQGVIQTETASVIRILSALLITKHDHVSKKSIQDKRIKCVESDHPLPKQNSLDAGQHLLAYLEQLPEDESCVFLISGGASALVEVLEEGWDLAQLQELTDYLLANAYSINQINAIRQRLSKVKGGGLWSYIGDRRIYCLMISDVPDDDPVMIGSGLLFPAKDVAIPNLAEKWQSKLLPFSQKQQQQNFQWKIIASLEIAKNAVAKHAKTLGYDVSIVSAFLSGSAENTARECVTTIKNTPNTLFVWGGETTVELPNNPGKGGRNQHLALSAVNHIKSLKEAYLLSAGTDGTDGITDATGAIVDSSTSKTAMQLEIDVQDFHKRADAYCFFEKTGDLIKTGATGTNVMDLVLAISVCDSHQ